MLAFFYIKSLYTNIDTELGLIAITYFLDKYYDQVELNHYPKTVILNFLNIVLNNNYFEYKNTYFKQTSGCAMGSICSPTYAILVLAYCEDQIFEDGKSIFNETETEIIIKSFYRFISEILILWPLNVTK